jgi:DNA topoisomerase-1
LPQGASEEAVSLEAALQWLSLPRTLGADPESGEEVVATSGRYGPYVKRGNETRSLGADDDVYSVELARALELLAQPKTRGRAATRRVVKEYPDNLQLLEGRYGPYLTNGELNVSLPRDVDPQALTAEHAARLLAERGKPPKRSAARPARKAAGRKTTRRKS